MRYFYNESTHRLHIEGFCFVSRSLPHNVKCFSWHQIKWQVCNELFYIEEERCQLSPIFV